MSYKMLINDCLKNQTYIEKIFAEAGIASAILSLDNFSIIEKCSLFKIYFKSVNEEDLSIVSLFSSECELDLVNFLSDKNLDTMLCKTPIEKNGNYLYIKISKIRRENKYLFLTFQDVSLKTVRKKELLYNAFSAISGSHPWFEVVRDQCPYSMSVTGPDGRFISVNQHYANLLGRDREEIIGKTRLDLLDELSPDRVDFKNLAEMFISIHDAIKRGKQFSKRYILSSSDSRTRYALEHHGYPVYKDNEYLGYVSISIDITSTNPQLQDLKDKIEYSQGVLDTLNTQMNIIQEDGRIIFANEPWIEFTKESEGDENIDYVNLTLGNLNIQDIYGPEYAEEYYFSSVRALINDPKLREYKNIIKLEMNGKQIYYSKKCSPIYNKYGKIEAFSNVFEDITDYLSVINENKQKEIFVSLFQDAFTVYYWHIEERNGNFIIVNSDQMSKIVGHKEISISELRNIFEDSYQVYDGFVSKIQDVDELFSMLNENHIRNMDINHVDWRSYKRQDDSGFLRYFKTLIKRVDLGSTICIGMTYDDTIVRREFLKEQRNAMSTLLSRFVAGTAHEINNYTQGMLSTFEMLQEEITTIDDAMSTVYSLSERSKRLTNALMNYSKNQETDLIKEGIEVLSLVNESVTLSNPIIKKEFDIEVLVEGVLPKISLPSNLFKDALLNVILNSRQAIDEADREFGYIKIKLDQIKINTSMNHNVVIGTLIPNRKYIVVSVQDNGIGMTESQVKKCTEIFFTTKESGTGLGTGFLHSLSSQIQGAIEIKSKYGVGTELNIYLPLEIRL